MLSDKSASSLGIVPVKLRTLYKHTSTVPVRTSVQDKNKRNIRVRVIEHRGQTDKQVNRHTHLPPPSHDAKDLQFCEQTNFLRKDAPTKRVHTQPKKFKICH